MQKRIDAKKPDVRNVRMSEVRNGEGKKEIMGKIREKRDLGSTFLAHLKCFFFFFPCHLHIKLGKSYISRFSWKSEEQDTLGSVFTCDWSLAVGQTFDGLVLSGSPPGALMIYPSTLRLRLLVVVQLLSHFWPLDWRLLVWDIVTSWQLRETARWNREKIWASGGLLVFKYEKDLRVLLMREKNQDQVWDWMWARWIMGLIVLLQNLYVKISIPSYLQM